MSRRSIIVALGAVATCFALLSGTAAAQQAEPTAKSSSKPATLVSVWTYVGPRAALANATITLTDASGRLLGKGRTSKTGSYKFDVTGRKALKFPLTVRTAGGAPTALLPSGRTVSFGRFKGHLSAPVFGVRNEPITQVSLISTVAGKIAKAKTRAAYDAATAKVERTLGFGKVVPSDIMRLRNPHVGFRQLVGAVRRAGGFDAFADRVAEAAAAGRRVKHLRPPSANASGAISARLIRGAAPLARQSSTSSGPVCSAPLPDGQSTSDQVITDVAEIGVGALMKVAGAPSTASSSITGMAFAAAGVPTSESEAEAANSAIWNELQCIDEQIAYLQAEVADLTLMTLLTNATTCDSALQGPHVWQGYEDEISDNTSAPINPKDPNLIAYVGDWSTAVETCGDGINYSLNNKIPGYTTTGWQQMVLNTVGSSKWWSQSQVQDLQSFLSYWGARVYQQFILSNEVNNFNGTYTIAANDAAVNPNNTSVCKPGSTASSSTYCVYRSNIMQAYPPDLYSDELAVVKNGLAVNAIPLGVFSPTPIMSPAPAGMASSTNTYYKQTPASTQKGGGITNVNPGWFFNYYLNFTPVTAGGYGNELRLFNFGTTPSCLSKQLSPCPGTTASTSFAWGAVTYFNGLAKNGVNPKGYGTAVETYDNPQAANRTANNSTNGSLACGDVSDINSKNTMTGQTGLAALYAALNQAPNGGSGPLDGTGYDSGDVLYMVNDGNSYVTAQLKNNMAYLTWNGCMGNMVTGDTPLLSEMPIKPLFATMTSRAWWYGTETDSKGCTGTYGCTGSGASTASKFLPGNPPTS